MRKFLLALGLVAMGVLGNDAAAQHSTDFWVGQNDSSQMAVGGVLDLSTPAVLAPSTTLGGWASQDPGFDSVVIAEPGLLPMNDNAEVWFEITSISPGLQIVDSSFQILDGAGDSTFLGFAGMHVHNTWNVIESVDPDQCHWHCTFTLNDASGNMATSEAITIVFQNVEATIGDVDQDGVFTEADHDAFLAVLADPGAATQEERASADVDLDGFVTPADECPLLAVLGLGGFVRGDTNDDESVSLVDGIVLLNYLFVNGVEPQPFASGDVNDSGDVGLPDAIYLLNYLFSNGPQPPAPFPDPGC